MKKYILTSSKFTGTVVFGYNPDTDYLQLFDSKSDLTELQHRWLLQNLPYTPSELTLLAKKMNASLEEIQQDISFEAFWDTYGKKVNMKRCKPLFSALSDECKLLAIGRIRAYFKYCERTGFRGIADPDKYLRNRYFETDWNKER